MEFFSFLYVIVFGIIAFIFLIKILGLLYPYFFWGAINVPTKREKVEKMVELLQIKNGQSVVDLGSGEGRLVIALAKAGAKAYGYEINPFLVLKAKRKIQQAGLQGKAFVYWKNFWNKNLENFDAVTVYGMKHIMAGLGKKLKRELRPGAKVVSNYFTLPEWSASKVEDKIYLYIN